MEYPTLNVKQKSRQMSDAFLGYNHNLRINESEFYDMKNMTSDYYPVLAPRKKRGVYQDGIKANGMIAKDKLCYVDGTAFVIGDERIEMELSEGPKDLISMGAYVIIMPDRKYISTIKKNDAEDYEQGDIDTEFTTTSDVKFTLCTITGDSYYEEGKEPPQGETAPENPNNGDLWIDTSSTPHTLKKFSKANEMWVSIATTYIKITSTGIGKNFKQYDGVKISGIAVEALKGLNSAHALWGCGDDYLIVTGILDEVATQTVEQGAITIARRMPVMDFIVESNNRLWGCRYGANDEGEVVNEIYACKLGDFKNWNCFMNLSTDSYTVSCGTDGQFTGAITHLGYPLFFKENCLHKVYGDYPANFQLQSTICRGVQRGSSKSLAIVNETLFYKSGGAVCAYDGSLPEEMSSVLGDIRYSDAVAGAHGNKYYITMKDAGGVYHLFVYDTAKGMWHKEDNLQVDQFCSYMNEMYGIDHNTKHIITVLGSGTQDSKKVPWMVETGIWGMSMPDMKYISRLLVRMSLEVGADVEISIQYDSMGDWEQVCQMTVSSLRSFSVPVRPRRCDHFRLRIEGEGEGRIYSITKTIEQGSDIS
jgi:hypothetical protein